MTDFRLHRRHVLTAGGVWIAAGTTRAFGQGAAPVTETTAGKVRGFETQWPSRSGQGHPPMATPTTAANRFMPPKPPKLLGGGEGLAWPMVPPRLREMG